MGRWQRFLHYTESGKPVSYVSKISLLIVYSFVFSLDTQPNLLLWSHGLILIYNAISISLSSTSNKQNPERRKLLQYQTVFSRQPCYDALRKTYDALFTYGAQSRLLAHFYSGEALVMIYGSGFSGQKRRWKRSSKT